MMFRLTQEPGGLGCQLHGNGLRLAGVPLLFLGQNGFVPRPANEIQLLIGSAYGPKFDVPSLLRGLNTVARALNEKDMVRASIAAVHLRLPVLDWPGAIRIAKADDVLSKYDPDEPRDWHGRWTNGGGGATDSNVISPLAFIADDEGGVLDTAYQGVFHDWLVQDLANYFRAKGATVLTNVRLVAVDGTTAVADMLIWVPGKPPVIVEVKTGIDPTFTPNQRRIYPMAQIGGHVTTPDSRISAMGIVPGTPLPPLEVFFAYQQGPGAPLHVEAAPDPTVTKQFVSECAVPASKAGE